jgi:hypothetical protein
MTGQYLFKVRRCGGTPEGLSVSKNSTGYCKYERKKNIKEILKEQRTL